MYNSNEIMYEIKGVLCDMGGYIKRDVERVEQKPLNTQIPRDIFNDFKDRLKNGKMKNDGSDELLSIIDHKIIEGNTI